MLMQSGPCPGLGADWLSTILNSQTAGAIAEAVMGNRNAGVAQQQLRQIAFGNPGTTAPAARSAPSSNTMLILGGVGLLAVVMLMGGRR